MATYFLVLTDHGSQLLAQAQAGTAHFTISHLVLGDAHGQPYLPQSRANTLALVNERARVAVQSVVVVDQHVEVVAVVDSTVGGFNVHEIGLTDADGQLVYLGNYHGGYKPVLTEGAGGELELLLQLKTNGLGPVVIQADPTVVTASRQWVLDRFVRIPTFDTHVNQNALEHANLLLLIQQLTAMLAQTNEELMDTQVVQQIQQTLILMQQRLTILEQDRLEDVAVGDIWITTNQFADSNAVQAHKGYASTWALTCQGAALVGQSVLAEDPLWTKTIGQRSGAYTHQLTEQELPRVSPRLPHTQGNFNNPDLAEEIDANSWIADPLLDRVIPSDSVMSDNGWGRSTRDAAFIGGDQPHSIVQPSFVVAIWQRLT